MTTVLPSRPRRILVVGPSGSGKTTIALRLGRILSLEVIHLDREFWLPSFTAPDPNLWLRRVFQIAAQDEWVMDGNYFDTLDSRLARAQAVVWIDLPRRIYLTRLLSRIVRHYGEERFDLGRGLKERVSVEHLIRAYRFPKTQRPRLERSLTDAIRARTVIVRLCTIQEVNAFSANPAAWLAEPSSKQSGAKS